MPKDNILLITTDQQRFDTINAWGNQSIFTPHLNYMAAMGTSYTNCYTCCPICVPSRTTLMTGLHGYESGVVSNQTHEAVMKERTRKRATLPAMLTDAGYQTCAMGKMHFDPARACYGFEHMTLPLDYMRYYDRREETARPLVHGIGQCEMEPVIQPSKLSDTLTAWITDRSIDFLETKDPTRPFFMWTSYTKPHPPFDPCMEFWELYSQIPLPKPVLGDWSQTLEGTPQGFLAGAYENTNMHLLGKEQIQAVRRAYYACITQVDYQLGRLFGTLRENGLLENTWVIFTSDHGEMLGDHHMSQKNLFFEGSAHVPLLVMPPQGRNIPHNIQMNQLTELADLYPTILSIAGITPPSDVHSQNLLEPSSENRIFYGDSLHTNFCVMENRKKLVYTTCGGSALLFDLDSDPMEQRNLSTDPDWQSVRKHLWELLVEHVRQTAPEALKQNAGAQGPSGKAPANGTPFAFAITEPPRYPGDMPGRWFGFHCKDYNVDTFH